MIETYLSPTQPATVVHRVTGDIDLPTALQGAQTALQAVQAYAAQAGPLNLLLDLREMRFENVQAHRAWNHGFGRNPALQTLVQRVAILTRDTPNARAEQVLLGTPRVQFFFEPAACEAWLAAPAPSNPSSPASHETPRLQN